MQVFIQFQVQIKLALLVYMFMKDTGCDFFLKKKDVCGFSQSRYSYTLTIYKTIICWFTCCEGPQWCSMVTHSPPTSKVCA